MEKSALKGLFASGNMPAGTEYKSALADILQTFPYFQLAQVFFAKQLYDTHEPEASGRIKLASVYAPNRKAMYVLFKTAALDTRPPISTHSPTTLEPDKNHSTTEVKYNFIYRSTTAKSPEVTDKQPKNESEPASSTSKELTRTETFIRKELRTATEYQNPIEETEIAKQETISLLPVKKSYSPPIIEKEEPSIAKAISTTPVDKNPSATEIPVISIEENSILGESKKMETKPLPTDAPHEPISNNSLKYNFTSWLKVLPEISLEKKPPRQQDTSDIISSFLKNTPSISRPKAEFFSPVKAAKMSLTEDDTIVSETLAKIYFTQGNLQKALKAYETLLLQFPEKKNIFAARIEEIKALIRANTKPATK